MDSDFDTIRSKLAEIRSSVLAKHADHALATKISEVINLHQTFERRVYVLEMARANDNKDVSEPQLITNPIHKNIN